MAAAASNTVRFEVRPPGESDASDSSRVRQKDFLVFLQTGNAEKEVALTATEMLLSTPESAYDSAMRWAVGRYYDANEENLERFEAELMQQAAGIAAPPVQPFPEDERLDQIVTYNLPERTPLNKLFARISNQTGVQFEVHPELHIRSMQGKRVTHPLRELMRHVSAHKAEWVRQGDGYLLQPTEEPEADGQTHRRRDDAGNKQVEP